MIEENSRRMARILAGAALLSVVTGCKKEPASAQAKAGPGPSGVGEPRDPAAVVVSVGGNKLTEGELSDRMDRLIAAQGMSAFPAEQLSAIKAQVRQNLIESFIGQTVLEKEAARVGVSVSDEDVENRLAEIRQRIPEGKNLEEALQEVGTTLDQFREDLRRDLRIRKLIDEQVQPQAVSEQEVEQFYERSKDQLTTPETVRARHILISCEDTGDEAAATAAKKRAEETRQRILDGADFADVAREVSDCPSKAKGGDLGPFPKGQMVKEFEDAAFSQKVNEIGPVVRTKFGYHIIQVMEHQEAGVRPLEDLRDDIEAYLIRSRRQQATMEYVSNLVKQADVKYGE